MAGEKSVLIVEDHELISRMLRARLEKDGFVVTQALNGEEAIKFLQTNRPSLIILDVVMPKVSGFDVMKSIADNPSLSGVPIMVLSNLSQESDVKKVEDLGAKKYLVKSRVSLDQIVATTKGMLEPSSASVPANVS